MLAARVFFRERFPRVVVEDVAVLQNFDVRRTLVRRRLLQCFLQMLLKNIHGARDERRLRPDRQRNRIERAIGRAERSRFCFLAHFGRRRKLALRQTVNSVVEHEYFQTDVAAQHVDRVIAADRKRIAVARHHPNFQIRPRQFSIPSQPPARARESCGIQTCSCNTENGWSSRCRKSPRIFRAGYRVRETRTARRRESRSRRSPGTSGFPGRSESLFSCSTGKVAVVIQILLTALRNQIPRRARIKSQN